MHPLIEAEELVRRLDDPRWVIFDCRHDLMAPAAGEAAYRETHLPNARFAHLDSDLSGVKNGRDGRHPLPTREDFAAFLALAGVADDSVIVAYDAGNSLYAARLWWLARWIGHADVVVLDGGLARWKDLDQPLTAVVPTPARGRVTVRSSLTTTVDTPDIVANLVAKDLLVIDARAPERFRGEVEPLDPVAGHIPGAVNLPMAMNLETDGRFKDAKTLRNGFDRVLDRRDAPSVVQSCGSGVTACHGLLAMELAGLPGAALYPGSWSAWCSDPSRPVARDA